MGEGGSRTAPTFSRGLAYCYVDRVVAGGAGGVWGGFGGGLGLAVAVCGAHLEGIVAWGGVPVVDVLAPGIFGELLCEAGGVPGLAAVGRDLDLLDAAVRGPGDTAYRVLARGEVIAGLHGVDSGLGFDRALLRPGALYPVRVEVPVGELYLGEPLGGRDVAVEAWDDEADGVAVLYGELAAVQAEGDEGVAAVQRDVRLEARGKAVHAAAHELAGGVRDLIPAHARLREYVGEEHPGPASVGDQPAADGVRDAGERYVGLAGGHAEEVLVGELDGVIYGALDRELPAVHVYPGRSERGIYEVEAARRRDQLRHPRHVYGGIRRGVGQRLVLHGLPGAPFLLALPCRVFPGGRLGQVQLLGFGRALGGSAGSRRPTPAAASPATAAPPPSRRKPPRPTEIPSSGAGLPRPHDGRGRASRRAGLGGLPLRFRDGRGSAARSNSSLTTEPARRAPTMVITVGTVATNGSARAAATATAARTATPRTASDGRATARLPRRTASITVPTSTDAMSVGMSAVPRSSMPRVTRVPGVSSTIRWANETRIEGTGV